MSAGDVRRTLTSGVKAQARPMVKGGLRSVAAVAGRLTHRSHSTLPRVLCYHGVSDDPPDEWSVTPEQLRTHLRLIRRDYVPVPLASVVSWLRGGPALPPGAVAVTFDDGYVDVLDTAASILAEEGVPGTAFIASGLVSGRAAHQSYIPTRPIMDWAQVTELAAAGWTIGSHSLDHPAMARLDDEAARRQLVESRDELEQHLGAPVTLFAYPYGTTSTVSERDHRLAEAAGYEAAFLDMTGSVEQDGDRWAIPRSKVLGCDPTMVVRASLRGSIDLWRLVESRR